MKVETIYVCEKCGKSYVTSGEAEICESAHLSPEEIIECEYRENDTYPRWVRVKFSDGRLIGYSR